MYFENAVRQHLQANPALQQRAIHNRPADVAAVRALAQAAVNVELFTIPLYMTAMYSLQGMHAITGDNALYKGRLWPGMSTSAKVQTANQQCFNTIFSVFIQEMLHLQLASNIFNALTKNAPENQCSPCFTSPLLQDPGTLGWHCYGETKTTIPHIINLKDTTVYQSVTVSLGEVNDNTVALFLAIEEPADVLQTLILDSKRGDYLVTKGPLSEQVPFDGWTADNTEKDLPMFGTIAAMYECLALYLNLEYSDGTTLIEALYKPDSIQNDLFNTESEGHCSPEFPHLNTVIDAGSAVEAKAQILTMMDAITDQGEGSTLKVQGPQVAVRPQGMVGDAVKPNYQPDFNALKNDYVSYNDDGQKVESADAHARFFGGVVDHYDRFQQVRGLLESGQLTTWSQWHNASDQPRSWQASMLELEGAAPIAGIPTAEEVAGALNRLNAPDSRDGNLELFSRVAAGAIAGITTVLNDYWSTPNTDFPFPSMAGSGDRISICWAVFGQAPDLSLGQFERHSGDSAPLYHACQGLDYGDSAEGNQCASKEVFHTCRGSNACKGEGGCGFVQSTKGGSGCNAMVAKTGDDELYTAPGDNFCGSYGGCAVPISASQRFPKSGTMALYQLFADKDSVKLEQTLSFDEGDSVYATAWKAYEKVMASEGKPAGNAPEASDLRLAFPPST
ncbi:ferritin-like protein [Ferrimonas sp. SCSIO 43195]|uniref:ferritin-like protein n=1 Tax=Ferrimonas sp. SCSIO 43195 TaxID=2822844 RepID=UPI002075E069|nr:ferritin-like protein [Ferrimonas sp. SCSIO 43195]USD39273.1 hypothetical protein J8Z22_09315 [Ferrimonas sp. SCSIO 43195]